MQNKNNFNYRLSVIDQLSQTIFVESNPSSMEVVEITKQNESITYSKTSKQVELSRKSLDLIKSVEESINNAINSSFIEKLNETTSKNKNIVVVKFFKKSILHRLINKLRRDNECEISNAILDFGKDSTWVILSKDIYDIISKNKRFLEHTNQASQMYKAGRLGFLTVYLNCDLKENSIYFGKYDDFSLLLNKDVKVNTDKVEIQYSLVTSSANNAKKMIVI